MTPLSFVCWRWKPVTKQRSEFSPDTVRVLRDMVARHYRGPHRFICVTDAPQEIAKDIETVQDRGDFSALPAPAGGLNPSCYRRLRAFSPEMSEVFGERFVSIDLDMVLVGDVTPLFDRDDDFVIYGDTNPKTFYNGSLFMMKSGARSQVWSDFDPNISPRRAYAAGHHGSDQAWISFRLGPHEKKWGKSDGVYSFRNEVKSLGALPANARMVCFHGLMKPWSPGVSDRYPWVRQHYRLEAPCLA